MARSTGPIVAAGSIAWANNVLIADEVSTDLFTESIRMALVTGMAAMFLYGVEQVSEDVGVALAWTTLVTVLFVRIKNNEPTVLERAIDLVGVGERFVKR